LWLMPPPLVLPLLMPLSLKRWHWRGDVKEATSSLTPPSLVLLWLTPLSLVLLWLTPLSLVLLWLTPLSLVLLSLTPRSLML
jgi:hypothetical protein